MVATLRAAKFPAALDFIMSVLLKLKTKSLRWLHGQVYKDFSVDKKMQSPLG